MTSVGYASVEELCDALDVSCERAVEDTGLSAGEVFVDGKLVVATTPCFIAVVYGSRFRDTTAALLFARVCGRQED